MSTRKIVFLLLCLLVWGSVTYAEEVEESTGALPKISLVAAESEPAADQEQQAAEVRPEATATARLSATASDVRPQGDFYGMRKPAAGKNEKGKGKTSLVPAVPPKKSAKAVFEEVPLPPTSPEDAFGDQRALPEVTQKAPMSRSDVNRIVCPEPIKDVLYSSEKGVKVKYHGNNAFVKFTFETIGDDVVYSDTPTELHVLCGETTYTLVAVPMSVPPQTIRLGNGKEAKIRENTDLFRDDDTNKKIREVLRRAYKDDLPDSFTVKQENLPLSVYRDLSVSLRRTITIDGEGMVIKEFAVVSNVDGIELKEKQFLRKEISLNPAAIAIEPGKLRPGRGEKVRLFVVEFKAAEGGSTNNVD